jgi:ribosomal protein S18 acetylase RimI-like enzyme
VEDGAVTVGDLRRDELEAIAWSGSPSHLRNVAGQLDRRDAGLVDYLVVRDASGRPLSKGAVQYDGIPGAGEIMQLATRPDLQGRGYASLLIAEAERRIRGRGLRRAVLSVEPGNERAERLYAHLGYQTSGARDLSWEREDEDGALELYRTRVVDLVKDLSGADR